MSPLIQAWLLQSAILFLALGGVVGIWLGVLMLFQPHRLRTISAVFDRWISTRRFSRVLERNIRLEPWFYRHGKIVGFLIALGALYVLYFFAVPFDRGQAVAGLVKRLGYHPLLIGGLLDGLVFSALLGALCALLVALFLLFRPSLLRDFEQAANRWLSLRRLLKPLEIPRDNMIRCFARHPRPVGVFLVLGGLYTVVLLLVWLSRAV